MSSAAVKGQASADHCLPLVGKVRILFEGVGNFVLEVGNDHLMLTTKYKTKDYFYISNTGLCLSYLNVMEKETTASLKMMGMNLVCKLVGILLLWVLQICDINWIFKYYHTNSYCARQKYVKVLFFNYSSAIPCVQLSSGISDGHSVNL